jgi:hypothetical protein
VRPVDEGLTDRLTGREVTAAAIRVRYDDDLAHDAAVVY